MNSDICYIVENYIVNYEPNSEMKRKWLFFIFIHMNTLGYTINEIKVYNDHKSLTSQ